MSTDAQDLYQQGTSSNCCGATIMNNGLCSDCGEHCEDEEGPSDAQLQSQHGHRFIQQNSYRKQMKDAGRGRLLPP